MNALAESPWGVFTIASPMPIALLMGFALRSGGHNRRLLGWVTLGGIVALVAARLMAGAAALSGGALATSVGLPLLGGTVAAILSAWRAARVRPGDALRQI